MNDDAPDHLLPMFLSSDGGEVAQRRSSRMRIAGVAMLAAVALGAVVLLAFEQQPVARLAAVSFSAVDASADTNEATQPAQAAVEVPGSPAAESNVSAGQSIAIVEPAAAEPAAAVDEQQQGGAKDKTASDALFAQFQAWAQQQNGRPEPQQDPAADSERQITQDGPAQPAMPRQSAEAPQSGPTRSEPAAAAVRAAQKRRAVHELRNARAGMEAARRMQAKLSRPHGPPSRASEDTNAQEAPVPTSQTPSLLQILGWH